jgi:hypothetical protein
MAVLQWLFQQALTAWLQLRRSDERSPARGGGAEPIKVQFLHLERDPAS